jgi:O-acetylserine/cysteine efflux transporter
MSVIPPLPMLALSLIIEGPHTVGTAVVTSFTTAAAPAWWGLAFTIVCGTIIGSGIWVWLMGRHPAGTVAPFSMLVPVVGILLAWLVLGETPAVGEILGGMLVLAGVLWANGRPLRLPPARPAP